MNHQFKMVEMGGHVWFLKSKNLVLSLAVILLIVLKCANSAEEKADEKWKKKDVRDYTDADLERLLDQWEENDEEPLDEDEIPEWKKEPPKVDLSSLDPNDPEGMLRATKKGRTLMMFVTVSGNPTESETQEISQLWQSSLFNAQYEIQRYVVGDNRVLLMIKDGSKAWEIKDFLVTQERCELVTIEGKDYYGKAHPSYTESQESDKKKKKKSKTKKKQKSESPRKQENEIIKDEIKDEL